MKLDLNNKGWESVFRPWQIKAINILYKHPHGANTYTIHSDFEPREVSRASVIGFLATLAREGLVKVVTRTNKGGKQAVYSPKLSQTELSLEIVKRIDVFISKNLVGVIQ